MTDPTAEFFAGLPRRGQEPLLSNASGVLRFDLGKERWLITISRGRMRVDQHEAPADCVVRADRELFDNIASGRENAMAAVLRGAMTVAAQGPRELELLMLFDRLFPGPPPGWRADRLAAAQSGR